MAWQRKKEHGKDEDREGGRSPVLHVKEFVFILTT